MEEFEHFIVIICIQQPIYSLEGRSWIHHTYPNPEIAFDACQRIDELTKICPCIEAIYCIVLGVDPQLLHPRPDSMLSFLNDFIERVALEASSRQLGLAIAAAAEASAADRDSRHQ